MRLMPDEYSMDQNESKGHTSTQFVPKISFNLDQVRGKH